MNPKSQVVAGFSCCAVLGLLALLFLGGDGSGEREGVQHGNAARSGIETGPEDSESTPAGAGHSDSGAAGKVSGTFAHARGEVLLYAGSALVLAKRLKEGAFVLEYAPEAGVSHQAVFTARGFRARTFLLPRPEMDLGRVSLLQATGYGGRLIEASGGGVEGLVVEFRDDRHDLLGSSAPSDRDGRFRIDLETPAPLAAMHPGTNYLASCQLLLRDRDAYIGAVRAEPSGLSHRHEIRVPDRRQVPRIRIVSGGAGVEGIAVSMHQVRDIRNVALGPSIGHSVTDSNGETDLAWPGIFRAIVLRLQADASAKPIFVLATRDAFQRPLHDLALEQVRELSTSVVWAEDESPVPGAAVMLSGALSNGEASGEQTIVVARTGPDGTAQARWLPFVEDTGGVFQLQNWAVRYVRNGTPRLDVREVHGENLRGPQLPPLKVGGASDAARFGVWLEIRDEAGTPLVPRRITLSLFQGAKYIHKLAFRVANAPQDGAWFLMPIGRQLDFLDAPLDRGVFSVEASGRQWKSVSVDFAEIREAWSADEVLGLKLPASGVDASFRVVSPGGRPAAHVLVRILPKDAKPYETGTVLRVSTDAQGMATVSDLDRDREYVAFAIDPNGNAMALRDGLWPRGGEITLRLIEPEPVVVRAVFDDGEPVKEPRAISCTGWAHIAPAGLFETLTGKWLPDRGGLEFPPMVPELFTFDIQAFDRKLAKQQRMSPSTHRKVLAGVDLPKDRKVQLEPK